MFLIAVTCIPYPDVFTFPSMFSFMFNFNVQSTVAAFCLSIGRCAEQPLRREKDLRDLLARCGAWRRLDSGSPTTVGYEPNDP